MGEKKKVEIAEGEKVGLRSLPSCLLRYLFLAYKSEERAGNGLFEHVSVGGEEAKKYLRFFVFRP